MFTLCPRCKTIHALNARLLSQAGGQVRCGQCGLGFNALERLSDERPDGALVAPAAVATSSPPVLGAPRSKHGDSPSATIDLPPLPPPRRWPWRVLAVVLVLVTLGNLAWTFRVQLAEQPQVRDLLARFELPGVEPREPFRDPERIHLVSRDFHAHPSRPGVLVLSATIVNLAREAQELPVLSVTLLDADNRLLAAREFEPAEYVVPGADPAAWLQPNVHTPILLEFVDPGEHAVGFELAFR